MPIFNNRLFALKLVAGGGGSLTGFTVEAGVGTGAAGGATEDCDTGSGGRAHAVNTSAMMAILRAEIIVAVPVASALGRSQSAKCPKWSIPHAFPRSADRHIPCPA
jgi:hypothetical protein